MSPADVMAILPVLNYELKLRACVLQSTARTVFCRSEQMDPLQTRYLQEHGKVCFG